MHENHNVIWATPGTGELINHSHAVDGVTMQAEKMKRCIDCAVRFCPRCGAQQRM